MSEIALNVLVNVLSRPVHFPKIGRTGHLFIAEPPRPFVAPRLDIPGKDPSVIQKEIIFIEASALAGRGVGIVGCAVGAPFAVLVAEELFACGCELLISVTSAGQIVSAGPPPYFVIIDRALRDEGTSYHYAAPDVFAEANPGLIDAAKWALHEAGVSAHVGPSWTTDAPFRETAEAIAAARAKGILAVEMEAAALYTFARERGRRVLCLAHVTNTMGLSGQDFEKGEAQGADEALRVLEALARNLK